jgi:hypothetical protein
MFAKPYPQPVSRPDLKHIILSTEMPMMRVAVNIMELSIMLFSPATDSAIPDQPMNLMPISI